MTNHMSRWQRLWKAIITWWKNEPPPKVGTYLREARKMLSEYDDLYTQRIHPKGAPAHFSSQAAEAVMLEGHKRSPGINSEIRTLAIALERILGHLEMEMEPDETS